MREILSEKGHLKITVYSIWWYGWKALSLNFNWIENQLNIKNVMSKNVYVLCIDSVDID